MAPLQLVSRVVKKKPPCHARYKKKKEKITIKKKRSCLLVPNAWISVIIALSARVVIASFCGQYSTAFPSRFESGCLISPRTALANSVFSPFSNQFISSCTLLVRML